MSRAFFCLGRASVRGSSEWPLRGAEWSACLEVLTGCFASWGLQPSPVGVGFPAGPSCFRSLCLASFLCHVFVSAWKAACPPGTRPEPRALGAAPLPPTLPGIRLGQSRESQRGCPGVSLLCLRNPREAGCPDVGGRGVYFGGVKRPGGGHPCPCH